MAFCEKCGAQIPENGTFCAACGAPVAAQAQPTRTLEQPAAQPQAPEQQPQPPVYPQQPVYQQPVYPQQPVYDPADHTAEFDPEDVSQNKVIAMAAYILGTVGIIIALLAAPQSKYAAFHSRQALKLDIVRPCCSSFPLCLLSRSLCRLPALSALQFSSSCASSASSRYAAAKQRTLPSSASCRS
ncbi:zinc-ribbon domain-containing protein [Hominenteromicrobium sp.]|uniref:zinc-ribbon domain-containing protein n=1 Tax=Hominenteromicrobium sp. TaxID=3073581 RepID=UPI003A8F7547